MNHATASTWCIGRCCRATESFKTMDPARGHRFTIQNPAVFHCYMSPEWRPITFSLRPLWFGDSTNNLNQTSPWVYTVRVYILSFSTHHSSIFGDIDCVLISARLMSHLLISVVLRTGMWFRFWAHNQLLSPAVQLLRFMGDSVTTKHSDGYLHQKFLDITKNTGWWFGTMEFYDFPYIGII